MRRFIRKLTFNGSQNYDINLITEKTRNLVSDPYHQVKISFSDTLIPFIADLNYTMESLICTHAQFTEMMRSAEKLRAKNLTITIADRILNEFYEVFKKVIDCEALSLCCGFRGSALNLSCFHLLKSLTLTSFTMTTEIEKSLIDYTKTLQHLSLKKCSISDVSMLGSVPHLELIFCHNIRDISALNNNNAVIVEDCLGIHDFTHAFANSRTIKVCVIGPETYSFDLTNWTKVEELTLYSKTLFTKLAFHTTDNLPKTVKKCRLVQNFLKVINFRVTADHALREIELSHNSTITSLAEYDLQRVTTLICDNLRALQSLQGVGFGRNQKIMIRHCHKVTDFSPLSHVPIVHIQDCDGFTDPLQVRFVRDLTITPKRDISFVLDKSLSHPYENMESLTVSSSLHVKDLEGIEKIPYLQLDYSAHRQMRHFLEKGKTLQNQRIEFSGLCMDVNGADQLLDLHHRYLKGHYDYYNHFPKRCLASKD